VVERYVDALCRETAVGPPQGGTPNIDTIYFGGGTPSLLSSDQVERLLDTVYNKFDVQAGAEITMEMNPATVSSDALQRHRELGINRASFGVQTFDDRALKLLARGHNADDARNTFSMLRDAGFDNVSFDLIAGLPHQTIDQWQQNLDEAIQLAPEHISLYLLEIHQGTPLAEQVRSGRQPTPDDEVAAAMYELMLDRLAEAGYEQYEISNFARPGYASRHNSKYWQLDPVFGFGVSAHSFDGGQRYANERDAATYVELIEKTGSAETTREDVILASEYVFLGLRLENGIDLSDFSSRFGFDLQDKYRGELNRLKEYGLIANGHHLLKLTRKGKLFSNEVFQVFV
jgi:oxygen-independent coproporphyrinogen-3 oxidase